MSSHRHNSNTELTLRHKQHTFITQFSHLEPQINLTACLRIDGGSQSEQMRTYAETGRTCRLREGWDLIPGPSTGTAGNLESKKNGAVPLKFLLQRVGTTN